MPIFILGRNFGERELVKKSLQSFFGVGPQVSARILSRFHIHPTCKVGELANKQVLDLTAMLSEMKIENDLRRSVLDNIKRLKDTGTYRGRRHALGLPVRGQRTRCQVGLFIFLLKFGEWIRYLTLAIQNKTAYKLNRVERRL
ncbi:mitochondrial 37S ribosomal protein uS13m [Aspergillus undulatus]|uniref:mitochondrial 37S ribosomal protein uS13m n=1 Tax=Aspergillus undulatus TaxID=1810928 RepID=UPI003CCCB56D